MRKIVFSLILTLAAAVFAAAQVKVAPLEMRQRTLANGLHIVSVGIKHISGVVARVVVRPLAGGPVFASAGRERGLVSTVSRSGAANAR